MQSACLDGSASSLVMPPGFQVDVVCRFILPFLNVCHESLGNDKLEPVEVL